MPIGIKPTNDFAFKKTFGSPSNKAVLISLLNSILGLPKPIADVTIENPFSIQDFQDDKLSILDIKAFDQNGSIYDIEMQLTTKEGLVKRIVYYGCEIFTGQLRQGQAYDQLNPAYSICLINSKIFDDGEQVHHAFRFTDSTSGRTLEETLEIHTLELGKYNKQESDLSGATMLECWLYWLIHASDYETEDLLGLLPQSEFQLATKTITDIRKITEDKVMYDAREKAIRDKQWIISASIAEGKAEGKALGKAEGKALGKAEEKVESKIELIQTLQAIAKVEISTRETLKSLALEKLSEMAKELQERLLSR